MGEQAKHLQQYIYKLKVLLMGDQHVGKSTLIYTYLNGKYVNHLPITKDTLSFHVKKVHYCHYPKLGEKAQYECRFHLWDVSGSILTKNNYLNTFGKLNMFNNTLSYILAYKDKKSYDFIRNQIWQKLPKLQISIEPVYLVQLVSKQNNLPLTESDVKQIQTFANKQKLRLYGPLNIQDAQQVNDFFKSIMQELMRNIIDSSFDYKDVIIKDRNNKIVLKDVTTKEHQYFQKRYNRCC